MFYSLSAKLTAKRDPTYLQLSLEQKQVYDMVVFERKSVFFTGQAGSGKSFLIRAIIQGLQRLLLPEQLAVTAMTGIAAVNIAGQTLHSLFASPLNFDTEDPETNVQKQLKMALVRPPLRERLNALQTILIDEVSMLQGSVFDTLELLLRKVKRSSKFFGDVQLVLCGDFMQLPPIKKQGRPKLLFESSYFSKIMCVKLTVQFRQQDDQLINMLNKIRNGQVDDQVKNLILSRKKTEQEINRDEESKLKFSYGQWKQNIENMKQFILNSEQQSLKMGFFKKLELLHQTKNAEIQIRQAKYVPPVFPIRLYAYKTQVEQFNISRLNSQKRQVFTVNALDEGITDKIEKPEAQILFSIGAQVMLTKNIDVTAGLCNGSVGIIVEIKSKTESQILNVILDEVEVFVKFSSSTVPIKSIDTEQIGSNGKDRVGLRKQLPLQLSYAISIHKSQGLTLDAAVMDLKNCFENGQVYVALSRIRSLEGLVVTGINFDKITADQSSMVFCEEVKSIEELGLFPSGNNLIQSFTIESDIQLTKEYDSIPKSVDLRVKSPHNIKKSPTLELPLFSLAASSPIQNELTSEQASPSFPVHQQDLQTYIQQKSQQICTQSPSLKRGKLTIKPKNTEVVFIKAADVVDISDSDNLVEPVQKLQSPTIESQPKLTQEDVPIIPILQDINMESNAIHEEPEKQTPKNFFDFEYYLKFL
ncbi:ATP-dependent DNA helicase [Spironucleus salmonicida]|uniref:ATP-dependent DNA helicase n=1 Tax=Spironucleus salmonicida TaxID=348837 RepID=A0A9P8RYT5_9EUKA|nr:ATP-dependent DNA helicase [Spironucleus salmonicida]KAH0574292.1 ATP-dependent DNA helicase [Spironucleus salmonicida]